MQYMDKFVDRDYLDGVINKTRTCGNCACWVVGRKFSVGQCSCPKFVYIATGDDTPENGLGYWDQESYLAGFETGINFGCVNWSPKASLILSSDEDNVVYRAVLEPEPEDTPVAKKRKFSGWN